MFGDMFGAVDGSDFSGCDVPTTTTWIIAIAAMVIVTGLITVRWSGRGDDAPDA
jgi:hypothetical protein